MIDEMNVFHIALVKLYAERIVVEAGIDTIVRRADECGIHEHAQVMINRKGLRLSTVLQP